MVFRDNNNNASGQGRPLHLYGEHRMSGEVVSRSMMKSELIELMARKQNHLAYKDVELAVKSLLEQMSEALATGDRIEIRGFGSFSLHFRPPRAGRNPKTGDAVSLPGKHVPHFKPGKELRERVNETLKNSSQNN